MWFYVLLVLPGYQGSTRVVPRHSGIPLDLAVIVLLTFGVHHYKKNRDKIYLNSKIIQKTGSQDHIIHIIKSLFLRKFCWNNIILCHNMEHNHILLYRWHGLNFGKLHIDDFRDIHFRHMFRYHNMADILWDQNLLWNLFFHYFLIDPILKIYYNLPNIQIFQVC